MKKDVTKMCYLLILYSKARNEFGIPHRIYEKDKNNSNLLHSKLNITKSQPISKDIYLLTSIL